MRCGENPVQRDYQYYTPFDVKRQGEKTDAKKQTRGCHTEAFKAKYIVKKLVEKIT